jgi:hypothetical protein
LDFKSYFKMAILKLNCSLPAKWKAPSIAAFSSLSEPWTAFSQ